MEGKDPRAAAPPRPQAERPEAPHPVRAPNFLNDLFGFHGGFGGFGGVGGVGGGGGGGGGHHFSVGLGLFPGLFFNFNLGNTLFGGAGAGNQSNPETSRTYAFINRLLYSLALFVMLIIFMM
jgi:hypothetical protein